MIILDTNVISALMAEGPVEPVDDWLNRQPSISLWTTSITVYEIQTGLALMPAGRRRVALQEAFDAVLNEDLQHRILDFDSRAAIEAANISVRRHRAGKVVDSHDVQIAGIAAARRGTVATRNVRHFSDVGIPVVNPWEV
jgi:hypothetical protein